MGTLTHILHHANHIIFAYHVATVVTEPSQEQEQEVHAGQAYDHDADLGQSQGKPRCTTVFKKLFFYNMLCVGLIVH